MQSLNKRFHVGNRVEKKMSYISDKNIGFDVWTSIGQTAK